MIQQLFDTLVRDPDGEPNMMNLENNEGGRLRSDSLTVAHHRVRNLGELLSYRRFVDNGTPVSVHFEREREGALFNCNNNNHN